MRRLRPRAGTIGPAVLVLAGMALFVTGVYVVVVRGGGALIGRTGSPSPALSVLATTIVALGFQPVRQRLRPVAARLARGERAAPYEILTRFRTDVPTDEVPARMARLLAEATGARYAQVWLWVDGTPVSAATWPPDVDADPAPPDPAAEDTGVRRAVAVRHAGELLGIVVVAPPERQPLLPVEEHLLAGLAAQAGLLLRAVRLRAELAARLRESAQRAADLRASRARVVAAQDAERRRLERDIHDGAQQHLVALAVHLRLARTLAARSSPRVPAVLADVRRVATDAIGTLTDLSRGIYPRLLTDAGLGPALRAAVAAAPLPVDVTVEPIDRPRPEIAATLYFCCLEAVQNAVKHAGARRVAVRVGPVPDGIALTVTDDGAGFAPGAAAAGTGLVNMRDRAESVGGSLRVDSQPGGGTRIAVHLPARGA